MDFLRRHLFFMICGLAGAGGIALGITGIQAMSKVEEKMNEPAGLYQDLNGLRGGASKAAIDAEDERIELVLADRDKVLESAKSIRQYAPLVDGSLPKGRPTKLLDFRERYGKQMTRLLESLNYGSPASPRDVDSWRATIEEEQAEEGAGGFGDRAGEYSGPPQTTAGVLTKAGARVDAAARAHINAAQSINCYAVHHAQARLPDRPASLDFHESMRDVTSAEAPLLEDVWAAQVGYWIQKDVVDVIAAMNNEVTQAALAQKRQPWVGIMPIKNLISIRLSAEYIMPDSEGGDPARPGGHMVAEPPGGADTVFTGKASGPDFEVMQFTVKMIMDQRDIPDFVNRLSKNSFYTLLSLSYVAVPPNRRMMNKIYGEEPTVNVTMDFEILMLANAFREWMPQEVCEYYEIACPERKEAEEEEEG